MYNPFEWDLALAQKVKAPALFSLQKTPKQPSIRLSKCQKYEGRNTKTGDMKHSVRRGIFFFIELPGYQKIQPLFQSSDSGLKGYEEIAICDFNIPVPC